MSSPPKLGLLDTTVFIANETGRELDGESLPDEGVISAITLAELHVGVLAAGDVETRARRLATLEAVADTETLPVNNAVAATWARLRIHLAEMNRRLNINDLWVAATALTHDLPVVTRDDDFNPIEGVAGLRLVRV